jgi:hypothetical protein
MTLEEMTARHDVLLAAHFRGVRMVEIDGRRVTPRLPPTRRGNNRSV